ncbi:MAG TPA: SDR family oxidoreductase [Acidimicrobiales bacterium]|nr:SDR family oxidoreductase [Acidimicrobiales bacterium]
MALPGRHWDGKTVLVTGSTHGIGRATAELFATEGAFVVVHGRDRGAGEAVQEKIQEAGGSCAFIAADLGDAAAPDRLVSFALDVSGRLDVLVNNAGTNVFAGVVEADLDTWERCMSVDLRAAWLCARSSAVAMREGASIVNIASNHASATLPGVFPYNVAKAGMVALTQSLAIELAPRGIRANVICPGYIDTPINEAYFATFPDPAAERERVEGLHPVRRIGRPADVACAVRFLADPQQCGFVTGSTFVMDGGRSALLQDPAS